MEIKYLDYIHPWLLEKMDFQIIQIFLFNTISINASIWNTQKKWFMTPALCCKFWGFEGLLLNIYSIFLMWTKKSSVIGWKLPFLDHWSHALQSRNFSVEDGTHC